MEKPATISSHSGHVAGVGFAPDGQTLVSGGVNDRVQRWTIPARQLLPTPPGHEESVGIFSPSRDSRSRVSGPNNAAVTPWSLVSRETVETLYRHPKAVACRVVFWWSLDVVPCACREPRRRITRGVADGGVVQ
jgi:WD40 repeat protein